MAHVRTSKSASARRHSAAACNLICIGDTHVGCSLGLMSPGATKNDEGLEIYPSELQRRVFLWWEEFWHVAVPEMTTGEPFMVCHLGDAIDGVHHGSVSQWSHNLGTQSRAAEDIFRPVVEECEGRYYHLRGTEAHVSASSAEDERLARALGAVPNSEGQHARYELWKKVGPAVVHLAHHVGTAGSQAYESSAVMRELTEAYIESAKWGQTPPDAIVRGHRHRYIKIDIPTARNSGQAVVCPGWQLKTPFSFRIAGARVSAPQFGGVVLHWSERHQELFVRHKVWSITRGEAE
jgi:UDP-2,3-diacylglucosamine pyrophosphatase LpxH